MHTGKALRFVDDRANDTDLTKLLASLEELGLHGAAERLEAKWAELRLTVAQIQQEASAFKEFKSRQLEIF